MGGFRDPVTGIYEETQVLRSSMLFVVLLQRDFCRSTTADHNRGFELVEEGARLGCHHCQGRLA
jgi:hypothetical protein